MVEASATAGTQLPPQLLDFVLQAADMSKSVQPSRAQLLLMLLQLVAIFRRQAAASNIWRWFPTRDNAQALVNAPVYHAPTPLPNDEGSQGEALLPAALQCLVLKQ